VFARQVPQLGALSILLGDEPALSAPIRFYQRLLSGDTAQASAILAELPPDADPADVLDDIVISGLTAARADRHRGLITAEQSAGVAAAAAEVAGAWLAAPERARDPGPGPLSRAVCVAIGDALDEAAAGLLAGLLRRERIETEVAPAALLLAEKIGVATAADVGVTLICGVGLTTHAHTARLCKILGRRNPQRSVLVVAWGADAHRLPVTTGAAPEPYAVVDSSRAAVRTALAILAAAPKGEAIDAA
jgi:hypothetical protein